MKEILITKDNIEEIVARQCDGIVDQYELRALNNWKKTSDENEEYYQKILKTNAFYADMKANNVDVDTAWSTVRSKMKNTEQNLQEHTKRPYSRRQMLKYVGYAASVLLIIVAGIFFNKSDVPSQYLTTDVAMSHKLDDGSVIELAENSALNKISESGRAYNFSGEAEFQIVHDDTKPFIVHMNDIIVKDLGTVFRIRSIPTSDTVFVKVTEGIAQFYTLSDSGIVLEEGEEGMYIKSINKFYKRSIDVKNQFLSISFENATLGEVMDHLSYSFRKNISIDNESIRNCNLTVDFSRASLATVKEIIEETLNLEIEEHLTSLSIEGEGCK